MQWRRHAASCLGLILLGGMIGVLVGSWACALFLTARLAFHP